MDQGIPFCLRYYFYRCRFQRETPARHRYALNEIPVMEIWYKSKRFLTFLWLLTSILLAFSFFKNFTCTTEFSVSFSPFRNHTGTQIHECKHHQNIIRVLPGILNQLFDLFLSKTAVRYLKHNITFKKVRDHLEVILYLLIFSAPSFNLVNVLIWMVRLRKPCCNINTSSFLTKTVLEIHLLIASSLKIPFKW